MKTDVDAAEGDIDNLEPLLPIETYYYTNPHSLVIGYNTNNSYANVSVLEGETIEIEAHVCLKKIDSQSVG